MGFFRRKQPQLPVIGDVAVLGAEGKQGRPIASLYPSEVVSAAQHIRLTVQRQTQAGEQPMSLDEQAARMIRAVDIAARDETDPSRLSDEPAIVRDTDFLGRVRTFRIPSQQDAHRTDVARREALRERLAAQLPEGYLLYNPGDTRDPRNRI